MLRKMKLKTCRNIEYAMHWLKFILLLPLTPIGLVGMVCKKIWTWWDDFLSGNVWSISNKMVRSCDEVKDGTIKNTRYKSLTAIEAYTWVESFKKDD